MKLFGASLHSNSWIRPAAIGLGLTVASLLALSAFWLLLSLGPLENGQPLLGALIGSSLAINLLVAVLTARPFAISTIVARMVRSMAITVAGAVLLFATILVLHGLGFRWRIRS